MRAIAVAALAGCTGVKPVHERAHAAPLEGAVTVVPGEAMELEISLRGIRSGTCRPRSARRVSSTAIAR